MRIGGWEIFAHPLFLAEYDRLLATVERAKAADPKGYRAHPAAVLLRGVIHTVTEAIPADPGASEFRQGLTLGKGNTGWFRAKIGRRFRLFYRFDSRSKVIVLAWLNDEQTLRKAGGRNDVYEVFARMLKSDRPPTDFDRLLTGSRPFKPG